MGSRRQPRGWNTGQLGHKNHDKQFDHRPEHKPATVLLTNRAFILVLRVLLGAMFVFSSADKVLHPDRFAIAIRAYEILPAGLTNIFALVVAWAELSRESC